MANWSKKYTTTFKSSKNRITRTNNSSGKSTYSTSKKVGNTRTTTSTSGGKTKIYVTETHPTLGTRRTVTTLNKTPRVKKTRPKKYSTRKTSYKPSNNVTYNTSSTGSSSGFGTFIVVSFVIIVILLLMI